MTHTGGKSKDTEERREQKSENDKRGEGERDENEGFQHRPTS